MNSDTGRPLRAIATSRRVMITKANDQSGTVGLVVDIDEGKTVQIEGLILSGREEWPEKEAEKLQAVWRPYAGGIY